MGKYLKEILSFSLKNKYFIVFCSGLLIPFDLHAQVNNEGNFIPPFNRFNKQRFETVVIIEASVATLATIGLQYLWYKKFPRSRFHFFNDNAEWKGMDKLGHATTAYNIAAMQYNLMRWAGVGNTQSIWIGGLTGLGYLTMIEIMDGFSSQWGFSKGDMGANIFGSALFSSQQFIWNKQPIQLRFSFHSTLYKKYNTPLLGDNFIQHSLKDYNGQTYWFSFNLSSFAGNNRLPRWLNIDFGIGAEGMTGAIKNPDSLNGKPIPKFLRQRKLFLGADGAFQKNGAAPFPSWMNIFRIPTPVLEWKTTTREWKGKLFYY